MNVRRLAAAVLALCLLAAALSAMGVPALAAYDMPYYIDCDLTSQIVTIYRTSDRGIERQMLCSSGEGNLTPTGIFTMPVKTRRAEREEWYRMWMYNCYAMYATRIHRGIMFHSLPYRHKSQTSIITQYVEEFGTPTSHGCFRLRWQDAEFIAKNCKPGTKVRIYRADEPNEDLWELLHQQSYVASEWDSYDQFLGIPEDPTTLGRFSEGPEVYDLQYRLRDLGLLDGEVTGRYGSSTINAVKHAQHLMGKEQTGVATQEFREEIFREDAPTAMDVTLSDGMCGPAVVNLQRALQTLLLYDGALDGIYDVDVEQAVRLFQAVYYYDDSPSAESVVQKAIYYESNKLKAAFPEGASIEMARVDETIYLGAVNCKIGVLMRDRPSTDGRQLAKLNDGERLYILERAGEWSKVKCGSLVGYVKNDLMRVAQRDMTMLKYSGGDRVYTVGNSAEEFANGAVLPCEVFAEYLASGGSLENVNGLADFATVVTQDENVLLNLRQAPSTESDVLLKLENGTRVKVLLRAEEWSEVDYRGICGYLMNEFLDFWRGPEDALDDAYGDAEEDGPLLHDVVQCALDNQAPVYQEDDAGGKILGYLPNGVEVDILQYSNGWCLIAWNGYQGYMIAEDLEDADEPEPEPPLATEPPLAEDAPGQAQTGEQAEPQTDAQDPIPAEA